MGHPAFYKNSMYNGKYIFFAPLQGYTDAAYRRIHYEVCGGVDEYYTPFVRWEKEGVRKKDLRDINLENNRDVPTVPQVIAKDRNEFAWLCDSVQEAGWRRIDLNMGCPFPLQVHAGRGCGLLSHPERVGEMAEEMCRRSDVQFSVKMRLGQDDMSEALALMPIINAMPLTQVTLHPRLGRQQYKGSTDREAFGRMLEECCHPVVYNGDITELGQVDDLFSQFDTLKGVMLGRGLLARPWLFTDKEPWAAVREMHSKMYDHACRTLQGDSQILARLHAFWEYQDVLPDKKQYKAIMKSGSLRKYDEAVAFLSR